MRCTTADYVELGARSAFSFLEGASLPEQIAERAAELGHGALALADVDGLYGAPRFAQAAERAGLRALVGARVSLLGAGGPARPGELPPAAGRVLLLVQSPAGYRNLCRLLTLGHASYAKPHCRVPLAQLREHAAGLLALVRSPALAVELAPLFGERLYAELRRHALPDQERRNQALLATGLPPVATGDVRHARAAGRRVLDAFTCLRHGTTLERAGRLLSANAERQLQPARALLERFADLPAAIANTRRIAESCEFGLRALGYAFPDFPLQPGESARERLRELAQCGARERYAGRVPAAAQAQLAHELGVVGRLGLEGYFLIVWDIARECRARGILVQGRGSAANSLLCYALGITAIDPIRYGLLFERFLSEERGEWPDIDLDLPSGERREQILQYVYARYGPHGAAMTASVVSYRGRSAVREMGKVLGLEPEQLARLARSLSQHEYRDEHDALAPQLRASGVDPRAPRVRQLLELVAAVQNLPRHLGQHSGGMVIARGRLDEMVPLEPARMPGRRVLQWDKDDCAGLGMIKIDLLGLGMLAVLEEVIPLVREHEGTALDLAQLPEDDPKTYAMLARADTMGVFQVESRAQMATLPRLAPARFYDLVIAVAIIRPGPIVGDMVQPYLRRRAGREPVRYAHPDLEPILQRTLGVPLFQEQLLRMAMAVAGFSGGEAEELRSAVTHKRCAERMRAIERRLREGMSARGIAPAAQEQIAQQIRSFALYGFPESHAASFALLAYASAYIRAHHPACFLAAMLDQYPLGFYHPASLIQDAQRHGVQVLPIDVQHSGWRSRIEGGAVRVGLRYASGLCEASARRIEAAAPFASLADLAQRAAPGRAELERLAQIGACASLGLRRREALWQAAALERGLLAPASPQGDSPLREMSPWEQTAADYRGTGLTVGPHLVAQLRADLARRGVTPASALGALPGSRWARIAGAVIVRQRPGTAKGMLFITLEDETGTAQAIVRPAQFRAHRELLQSAGLLLIEGPLQSQDGVVHVLARRFERLEPPGAAPALPQSHDFH